jgi:signal transduction histidine kinase/CheY-like chemotaxis protein
VEATAASGVANLRALPPRVLPMPLFNSLRATLIGSMIAMAVLAVGLVGSLWIAQEYSKFETESARLRAEYVEQQRALIKQEVDRVVDYIEYQRSTTEAALKKKLKERVDQAWASADGLYSKYRDNKSTEEIKSIIRESLRAVRFDQGRGYYFIYDMQGVNVLLPYSPQLEGRNLWDLQDSKGLYTIRRMVELVRDKGEGFLSWHWYKPGQTGRMSEKIGYSKIFAPLGWWIGSGEYIEDVEQEIQAQTLARINTIRFGADNYIFVYDFQANTLAHYKPENLGVNQWEFRDPNGVPVLQELIRGCRQQDGVFLEYMGTIRPATGQPAAKQAYARAIKEWQWMVGAGVYTDEINQILAEKRAALSLKIKRDLALVVAILALSLLCTILVSQYITGRIAANLLGFTAFFERAATGSSMIDHQSIHFAEFKGLALAANQMIDERNRAAAAIDKLREQLDRSRKMEALGVLAGGVAHDLNNVLAAVVGYPDLILASMPAAHPQRRYIEAVRDSGLKAGEIVQDLLTLARRGVVQSAVLDLNGLVRGYLASPECIRLCANTPDLRVETDLAPDLLGIKGSRVHVQKTIMNLIVNAAEAQPRGGAIRVATENRYLDQPLPGYERIHEGEYAVLLVADEGVGISEGDLAHIFEPFFSKKKLGRSGTGLGMTVVWGTVEDHGGYITVSTREGQGALFELYFPATREAISEEEPSNLSDYQGKGQRLLVVDDLDEQRNLAKAMLERLGYRVETAAGGEIALARLAEQPVDLLLLDMIMEPGIDGLETYQRALALNPGQRAILVSGYAETDRVQQAMALGARRYLKKPYTIDGLAQAVWAALQ